MDCPKCTGTLEPQQYGANCTIHRCNVCHGLWCRPEALMKLKSEWMSEAVLDVGSPKIGKKLNEVRDIACPEGHGCMQHRADEDQRHVWFEQCEECGGIFLDAGEFTDLKFKTLLDWVKGLLARAS